MQGFRVKSPVLVGLHYSMLVSNSWMYLRAKFMASSSCLGCGLTRPRLRKGGMERKGVALVEEMTIWGHLKKMGSPEKPKPIGSTWFRRDVFRGHADIQFTT